ncbi:MAG TPA: metal-dependent hydrolase [Candidatus Dormibacteraeota bacterium]|nr:metal-dependent hydrolase [Candidatus Dormibacteraeota bacterium]
MDITTHALASLALARTVLHRAPRLSWLVVVAAGVVADADVCSVFFGPSAYLLWHRTYTHSILASILWAAFFGLCYRALAPQNQNNKFGYLTVGVTALFAQWLHLAMDTCQWEGVQLLWPFRTTRMADDWLASVDLWIIVILAVALVLPELLHLVSGEIGAVDKGPRGRTAAIAGLTLLCAYVGVRAILHSSAVALLQSRAYSGEPTRRVAAFPESASLTTWHGIVETESTLHVLTVKVGSGGVSDSQTALKFFKPEPTPILETAQNTQIAKDFLRIARFPKATVVKIGAGYEVELLDLRYKALGETRHEIVATIDLDATGKVASQNLIWAEDQKR